MPKSPGGRYVVGTISKDQVRMFRDRGIEDGDDIVAPDGFPAELDMANPPEVSTSASVRCTPT